MEFFGQRFFCGPLTRGIVGGRINTTRFAVIFLTSSGGQAIFLNVGAATFLTTQHGHAPYLTYRTTAAPIIPLPQRGTAGQRPLRQSPREDQRVEDDSK